MGTRSRRRRRSHALLSAMSTTTVFQFFKASSCQCRQVGECFCFLTIVVYFIYTDA